MDGQQRIDQYAQRADAEHAAALFKALANPARVMILRRLSERESNVGELEAALGMGQAYVSQQLARLRAEGLVEGRRNGRIVRYTITDDRIRPVLAAIFGSQTAARDGTSDPA